ncbi:UDP-glucuronosyltransferase 2C1-like isoform X2 [Poecilia reticulata]|uniref:UDP-glucuronosyltransferase 2C1-like isoform X2 n=1 Tax=Poecilia reticulata TaxID=8081 RepID=UPI0007EB15D4|nr:PREDICTED: UDP-glucuronosyltransferase 2C1-like isoform X2 [Poecilia reticulata]XP_017159436.1 PREDICTED: UDP-glucuronosyltransferase 2C1-like isoform X2 [Poecilia reticulata]
MKRQEEEDRGVKYMKAVCCCSVSLLLVLIPTCCHGGNILVFPTEGSHWINMEILLKALHSRGHNVTVARASKTWYIKDNPLYYKSFIVPVEKSLVNADFLKKMFSMFIKFEQGTLTLTRFFQITTEMLDKNLNIYSLVSSFVPALLDNVELMRKLNETKFDLVLTDPCWGNGAILAKYMNLPLVYNVRWLMPQEAHFAIAPSPLSYIPMTGSGYTDKMTFFRRVKNIIFYLMTALQSKLASKLVYQPLCEKYLGPDCDFEQIQNDADIWLMRTDFVFDYPRPTMPNVVYMGGFNCKPPEPLPDHMEEFVQSSGEHGVIIMSISTFVDELPEDLADSIAAAFAKLPQKVIWSFRGPKPSTLGNNTLLTDWMPQKDLLGHPKIKLFVSQGGTNGVQEALCHGVPVVGFPLVYDQYDNLLRLQEKGAAKILTFRAVDKDDGFLKAMQEVLNEPSYRQNMQRLSRLHRDQPMRPIDTAVFWIEYVIRHKGAGHLKAQSNRMPWYVYHSVDVFLFLTAAVMLTLLATVVFIRCLWKSVCRRKVKRE